MDTSRIEALLREQPLLEAIVTSAPDVYRIRARAVMDRDATIITGAIAAFRSSRGFWPASIDEALREFPVQPLRRDYFGHELVYRIEHDRPILYSVGPDGKDDGGVRKWNDFTEEGDLVYIAPVDAP